MKFNLIYQNKILSFCIIHYVYVYVRYKRGNGRPCPPLLKGGGGIIYNTPTLLRPTHYCILR